jgi:hypothetical protein
VDGLLHSECAAKLWPVVAGTIEKLSLMIAIFGDLTPGMDQSPLKKPADCPLLPKI